MTLKSCESARGSVARTFHWAIAIGAERTQPSFLLRKTWFRSPDGRRYGWEIAAIVVLKLALLAVLWYVFIKPWTPPPVTRSAIATHLYLPATPPGRHD